MKIVKSGRKIIAKIYKRPQGCSLELNIGSGMWVQRNCSDEKEAMRFIDVYQPRHNVFVVNINQ
jgi:hypothetical protein